MASLITNNASMTALQTLKSVQSNLTETQGRVSTGLKVQNAKDNAAYYSIAQTMRGDSAVFNALSENLSIAGSSVSVARQGVSEISDRVKQIIEKVSLAQANGSVDKTLIQNDIDDLVSQIETTISQSTFNGQTLLDGTGTAATPSADDEMTVVTGIMRATDATNQTSQINTTSFTYDKFNAADLVTQLKTIDVAGADTPADLATALTLSEAMLSTTTKAEASFGMVEKRIENQQKFIGKLVDKFDQSVGALVDADMNKEAARLSALQVQEQLATQALSIANQAPQSILSLFR